MKKNIEDSIPTLDEISKRYKLPDEENKRIGKNINQIMLSEKIPSHNPTAIINIAPPGSGKTGLNGMGLKQFQNNNAIIINSDELKAFHPRIDEIAKFYPQYYTKVTNQESNPWTDRLFDEAIKNNYNVIFEGTGRNLKLLTKMIEKMSNYKIIVRGMAVNELNCLMSIIERYEGQIKNKGWGRLVSVEHFYKAYEEMLATIKQLETLEQVDAVEVYIRGNSPTTPIMIYSNNQSEFENAQMAVVAGRERDKDNSLKYFQEIFNKTRKSNSIFSEEKEILEQINYLGKSLEINEGER